MVKLFTNVLGVFILNKKQIVGKILFNWDDVKGIATRLLQIEGGSFCQEEKELINQQKGKEIEVENPRRFSKLGGKVKFKRGKEFPTTLEIGSQLGMKKGDILELNRQVNLELSQLKLKVYQPDKILIQLINAWDELEEGINLLVEHLREVYSLSFPELTNLVKEPRDYVAVISGEKQREEIKTLRRGSKGMNFSAKDEKAAQGLAQGILGLYSSKDSLEERIKEIAQEIAPNTSELVGPLLTARLVSLAGSLKKLALMPSSTIQILGAEKAFFGFLKRKKNPPKHGIIFQVPEIRSAKKKIRGKLSRTLASKIAIAVKTDFYKGNFIGDKLKEEFLKRVERLKER